MNRQPGGHLRLLVGGVILEDDLQVEVLGCLVTEPLEEDEEFVVVMALHALTNDLARGDGEGSKDRRCPLEWECPNFR